MMKAIIIEDEKLPAEALEKLVGEVAPDIQIIALMQSIEESVEWFSTHPMPDLAFMDIHLADGSSFSIFDRVKITCPVIFTTAYDEYALRAFEVNSIDYLLKPIGRKDVQRAIEKLKSLKTPSVDYEEQSEIINRLAEKLSQSGKVYKSSILVSVKDTLVPLPVSDIAYVYIENKIVRAVRFDEKTCVLDTTLDDLALQLNPHDFYRANRQYIIARKAVKNISIWFGNRVAVNLTVSIPERILVSRTHVKELKEWLTD